MIKSDTVFNFMVMLKQSVQEGVIVMKKTAKKLLFLVCFGGIVFLLGKLVQKDSVQDKLFKLLGEDTFIAAKDKVLLGRDLLMWPVDYVRALLP